MKKLTTFGLAAFAALSLQAQKTYLNTNFEDGIPTDFTNLDLDELAVGSGFDVPVTSNWFVSNIYGAKGKAVVSTSRHNFELPTDNWLITPQLHIDSQDAVFSWDAKSVHFDLRDGYQIMVSTTDNEPESFEPIYTVEKENYLWQHHVLSLADYAGQSIYIAIVHNSMNRFLLAVDNLYAGEPEAPAFDATNKTRRFCGNTGTTPVLGSIRNLGKTADIKKITCTSGLNVLTQEVDATILKAGEELDFNFDLPVQLNRAVPYQIDVETADGKVFPALTDSIICSYFPRTLLMEKGTAVWCTSCPSVMGFMNRMKETYQDEIIQIESHSTYKDYANLSYDVYDRGMSTQNYPVIYFNRYKEQGLNDKKKLQIALAEETPAQVKAEAYLQNNTIAIKAKVDFGPDINNSKDQYRLGFAIIEKHLQLDMALQRSSIMGSAYEEFGLMSSPFNKDLMFFHNTVKGTESAFIGVPQSLPAQIAAGSSHLYEGTVPVPANMKDLNNHTLIVFVLDYFNTKVLNATEVKINDQASGIENIKGDNLQVGVQYQNDGIQIQLPESGAAKIRIADASGRLIQQFEGTAQHYNWSTRQLQPGIYVLNVLQNGKQASQKIRVD